eukprot:TRINITY_DN82369_c0_g1_i1.p1 TRINITY_DN82369_c0_g1~~TRINITY_DN82369_c0_g1_i1.p1  ORF type:complete len:274 (+),score=41.34 TRINITY_DN82369_c0_g1_i1:46-822(+)
MAPQPAETCCGSCSLLQGVLVISSYTVVIGCFNILAILLGGPKDSESQSVAWATVTFISQMVHTLALFAGVKGLLGIITRDPHRLRVLLMYHVCELLMGVLVLVVKLDKACQEREHYQKLHKTKLKLDCQSFQVSLVIQFAIHACLVSYFIYIIWSLAMRIEAGEYPGLPSALDQPSLFGDQEMGERSGNLGESWLFVQSGGDPGLPFFPHRAHLNRGGAGGASAAGPAPFSGAPRNLDDNRDAEAQEPFQGTPYRLE